MTTAKQCDFCKRVITTIPATVKYKTIDVEEFNGYDREKTTISYDVCWGECSEKVKKLISNIFNNPNHSESGASDE